MKKKNVVACVAVLLLPAGNDLIAEYVSKGILEALKTAR